MSKKPPGKEKFRGPLKSAPKDTKLPSPYWLYLVIALVTVAFLVVGYLFYHLREQQMRQRVESELSIAAQLKMDEIAHWREERLADANILMGSPFFVEGVENYLASPADTEAKYKVLDRLAVISKSYPYQNILLVDANGSVLLALNDSVYRLGEMTLAQLAVAIEERKAVMTDFHYPPDGNSPHLDVIAPLFPRGEDSPQAMGAVVFCIDPSHYFWPLLQSWPIPSETAETLLVERDGDQVLFLNELRFQKDTALKLRVPLSQQGTIAVMAVLGREGVVEGRDYRGAQVLAVLKHVPDSPWYLVAKVDTSEVLSAWRFQTGVTVASVAGLLLGALAAIGLIWQRRQRLAYQALYQAEVEAQALRRHFEYLLKYANDIILLVDEEHHIVEANDRALESYGYRREEMLGLPQVALIPPGGFSSYRERLRKLQKEGAIVAEAIQQCKDGSKFPVEVSARSIEIEGKPYFQEIIRDITERKRADEELRASKARYKELADSITDVFFAMDRDLRYTYWNKASEELMGIAAEDALGKRLYDVFPDTQETKAAEKEYLKVLETGKPRSFVYAYTLNGKKHWFDINAYPTETGVSIFVKDITDRNSMEEALVDEVVRRRVLMERSRDGISILDEDSKLLEANQRFLEMLGYTQEEVRDFHTWDWDTQWTREELLEMGHNVDEAGVHIETLHRRKDGSVFDVELSVNRAVVAGKTLLFCVSRDITERKRAEEAIRRSEENFRDSIENSPLGIRILDTDGEKTLYANRALLDMWGYSSLEELEAVPREQRYTPEGYAMHMEEVEKRRREEFVPLSRAISIVRSDGEVRILLASRGELLWNGEKRLQVVYQDITERKRAEEMLSASKERYRLLADNVKDAIWLMDLDLNFLWFSPSCERLRGYTAEEMKVLPLDKHVTPESFQRAWDMFVKAMEDEKQGNLDPKRFYGGEFEFCRKDGSTFWAEAKMSFMRNEKGEATAMLFEGRDITERKRAEEALRLSEQNFRDSMEKSPLGIRILAKEGAKTVFANQAFLDMWGYTSLEELEAVSREQRYTPGSYAEQVERLEKRRRGKPAPLDYETSIVRRDGQVRHLSVSRGELFWGGEKVFQLVYQDITELKQATHELEKAVEELQRSNAELERFAYVASHDLQEPLRMVSSYTQLLERRYKDKLDADANDFINYAVGGAERMQELLNDLLVYSRVGTRGKPFKRTDMEAVLEAALDNLQVTIKESKARVTHDPLPTVMADEGQMVQLLQNLIGNAVKFRGKGPPRIHVSAEPRDSEWVFSVRDNGIGIESQYFDRIFLIFQRLHRDEYPGTGTGLAIAKKIVERHGGRIWVESQLGKGSTFYFSMEAKGVRQQATGKGQQA